MNSSPPPSLHDDETHPPAGEWIRPGKKAAPARSSNARITADGAGVPVWKRQLDLMVITAALPALLVVVVFIALWIKLTSPGPVLFRQERVGFHRARFLCWKFRSMRVGAETLPHRQHVQELMRGNQQMTKLDQLGDARMIPGGALLRASGMDELPQLINVWRGQMSLVGPRPCTTYEFEAYRAEQYARFDALPGLTGLWQVSGKNRTTFAEMVELDIRYVRTRSLGEDAKIMARTFVVLFGQVRSIRQARALVSASAAG